LQQLLYFTSKSIALLEEGREQILRVVQRRAVKKNEKENGEEREEGLGRQKVVQCIDVAS
jgi:hypothetical protein